MKRIILISFATFGIFVQCFAQRFESIIKPDLKPKKRLILIKTSDKSDNQIPFPQAMQALADSDLAGMQVFHSKEAIALFGERGEKGAIILTVMQTPNVLTTEQLLNKYAVSQKNRMLPIQINGEIALYPNLLFSASQIKLVSVVRNKKGKPEYINIATKTTEADDRKEELFKQFGWTAYSLK